MVATDLVGTNKKLDLEVVGNLSAGTNFKSWSTSFRLGHRAYSETGRGLESLCRWHTVVHACKV